MNSADAEMLLKGRDDGLVFLSCSEGGEDGEEAWVRGITAVLESKGILCDGTSLGEPVRFVFDGRAYLFFPFTGHERFDMLSLSRWMARGGGGGILGAAYMRDFRFKMRRALRSGKAREKNDRGLEQLTLCGN